ncbi:tetratricopeptide repeat-containing sulfotransferase family protein [Arenimonas sp.]|uniref:tetratricopeptide repeat-containing sulfotransferase family protein n=1 Tax=Arenimonas sp. TaxID=1872635 RepID=UPI0039E6F9E4
MTTANDGQAQRLWTQGENALARRDRAGARAAFQSLLALQPGHVPARLRLSTLATAQGRYRDAVAELQAIVALHPSEPELLALLAGMLHRLGESAEAIACATHSAWGISRDPAQIEDMADLLVQLGQLDAATMQLDRADRLSGSSARSLYLRSNIELFRGRLDEATTAVETCLARAPAHAQAHWLLSRLRRQSEASNHVPRLQALLGRDLPAVDRVSLAFALFKELDDLGRQDEAWQALSLGCSGKRAMLDYRPAEEARAFDVLQRWRPPTRVQAPGVEAGAQPIFIIGLPRTGTTLLERILGGHPDVENAGELDDLPLQLRWCCDRFSKNFVDAELFDTAARIDFGVLGRRYLQHAQWRARGKPRFTDKLPLNFLHAGFIAEALPQARILHMSRNPMDSCLSNLKELFAEAYPYSYRLDELAAHYGRYRRLMAHWHALYPGRILDIAYEELVSDPETQARRIFEFCGLDWAPESLDIASNPAPVSTASSAQVREGIHRDRVENWRKYAQPLEPLRERLAAEGWL